MTMSEKRIKHFSPGVCLQNGKLLPMMTVYFEDDATLMYVASAVHSYESVEALSAMWEFEVTEIKKTYDTETPEGMNAAAWFFIRTFSMKPDDCVSD